MLDRLLKASMLELLIAVPAHVLMCFGPGVWLLYLRRIDGYRSARGRRPANQAGHRGH